MSEPSMESIVELLRIVNGAIDKVSSSFDSIPKSRLRIPELSPDDDAESRRKALRSVLEELSSLDRDEYLSDPEIDKLVDFFTELYGARPKYRHSYADVCDVIFGFSGAGYELDDGVPYQVNSLADNINRVYSRMDAGSTQAASVQKLCDHIELERTRLRHFVDQWERIREYDRRNGELEKKAEADRKRLEGDFARKVDAMRMEFIAILGVFAAIVLAFNGAVGFSDSSIHALGMASGVRALVLVVALVGFVLINAISILMVFLWKMAFGTRIIIGTWPRNCLIAADVVLGVIIVVCALLSLPWLRTLVGLPV